jgi:hypothetical protein
LLYLHHTQKGGRCRPPLFSYLIVCLLCYRIILLRKYCIFGMVVKSFYDGLYVYIPRPVLYG